MKASEAIAKLSQFVPVKNRAKYPWLATASRQKSLYDCAAAVSWVLNVNPEIVSCGVWEQHFVDRKVWFTSGVPQPGDLVIFDWETAVKNPKASMGKGTVNHDHVGIVISANAKSVTYVSADSTKIPCPGYVTTNTVGYNWVTGYGRPVYDKE